MVTREGSRPVSAEQRLKELGIKLPAPPEPFGTYGEAVQTGNLYFLSGMLPTEGHGAKFIGCVGAELDVEAGRKADHPAPFNVLGFRSCPSLNEYPVNTIILLPDPSGLSAHHGRTQTHKKRTNDLRKPETHTFISQVSHFSTAPASLLLHPFQEARKKRSSVKPGTFLNLSNKNR